MGDGRWEMADGSWQMGVGGLHLPWLSGVIDKDLFGTGPKPAFKRYSPIVHWCLASV
jgi:hypothetical protein